MAKKFRSNAYNKPWIKSPVGYIEDNKLFIMYDELTTPISTINDPYGQKISHARCFLVYVRKPNEFVKDLRDTVKFGSNTGVYTYFKPSDNDPDNEYYKFECNSSMAEELISLAIAYALENVESARLTAKLNMRGLES